MIFPGTGDFDYLSTIFWVYGTGTVKIDIQSDVEKLCGSQTVAKFRNLSYKVLL